MNNLISVIIPVYNAEKYINRCVVSILHQSYTNLEIIIVNDGSTDNSQKIIEKMMRNDKRIILINQQNCGVSYARNAGIKKAKGKYICFVDSDDFIEKTMIEKMYNALSKSNYQLGVCGYYDFYSEKEITEYCKNGKNRELKRDSYMREVSKGLHQIYYGVLWNKIYIRDIIKDNKIKFRKDITLGEDVIFNLDYIQYISDVVIVGESLYYYTHNNEGSLTNNKEVWHQWKMAKERYLYYIEIYRKIGLYDKCKTELNNALSVELIGPTYAIVEDSSYKIKTKISNIRKLYEDDKIKEALFVSNRKTKFNTIAKFCTKSKLYIILYIYLKMTKLTKK